MILLAGGTGRLGTAVVRRRSTDDEPIRVLTRDPQRAEHLGPAVDVATGDLRDADSLPAALDGVRVVVAAAHGFGGPGGVSPRSVDLEGNSNLLRAAEKAGAEVILMSIIGASTDHAMELFRMKGAAEAAAKASGVPTTVIRAAAFAELWIDILHDTARRSGRPVVFGRGDNPINLVSVADVAHLVDLVTDDASARGSTIDIGGPENVSFNALVSRMRAGDSSLGPPRHVPPPALRAVAATVGRLKPELRRQCLASIAMDSGDFSSDGGSARSRYPQIPATKLNDLL